MLKIPKGQYCYDEKGKCPYYSTIERGGIKLAYCNFLNEGSCFDLTDEEFQALKDFHRASSNTDIYELYPLDLLWDSVKECEENMGEEDE